VPVSAAELEKARTEAGERLEKAEEKNARERPSPPETDSSVTGMLPLGMYTTSTNNHSTLLKKSSAALAIHTFLKTCELTLTRRGLSDGREIMVFNFKPRPDAQFNDNEKYIASANRRDLDRRSGSNSDSAHGLAIAGCGHSRLPQSTSRVRRKTTGRVRRDDASARRHLVTTGGAH
jgi:hypothetical protein